MASNVPAELPSGKNASFQERGAVPQNATALHADRIARNTSYLTVAFIGQKVLSLVYFVFVSRSVGVENLGMYITALNLTTLFGIFIDLSFNQVLIRETAKHPEAAERYLNATLALKLLTALGAYALVMVVVNAFHYPDVTRSLVTFSGLVMIFDSFTLSFYAILRGVQRLKYEAVGTILTKVIVMSVGIVGLRLGAGIHFVVVALLVGSVFNFLYSFLMVGHHVGVVAKPRWDSSALRFLGGIAVPFALAAILNAVYINVDQLLLSHPLLTGSRGASYVGWYGTAYKLTFSLQFFPAAVAAAIFPAMSAYYLTRRDLLAKTFRRAMFYLAVLAVPMSVGIFILAESLVVRLYTGAFQASVVPLKILVSSLLFVFLNYPVGYLLNATDRQARNTLHLGVVVAVNIVLNVLLIPKYTFVGTAIASLASSALYLTLNVLVARRIVPGEMRALIVTLAKTTLAAGVMGGALFFLQRWFGLLPLLAVGGAIYFLALFLVRGIRVSDGTKIYHALLRKLT